MTFDWRCGILSGENGTDVCCVYSRDEAIKAWAWITLVFISGHSYFVLVFHREYLNFQYGIYMCVCVLKQEIYIHIFSLI